MKRRAARVVVFLLLLIAGGAIVNVAVAWGCVYLGNALVMRRGLLIREIDVPDFAQELKQTDFSSIFNASAEASAEQFVPKDSLLLIWESRSLGMSKITAVRRLNDGLHDHDQLAFGLPVRAMKTQ